MDTFALNLIFGVVAAMGTALGGVTIFISPRGNRTFLQYFIALGAGFMLAAVFIEIIPESQESLDNTLIYVLGGYLFLHFFEHVVSPHFHFGEETHTEVMLGSPTSFTALLGLAVHAFFDGASIGAGFAIGATLGFVVFMAVILHKLPEGFTSASIMLAAGQKTTVAFGASVMIGVVTVIGAVLAFEIAPAAPVVLAVSAGALLYVAATDLIPEINSHRQLYIPITVLVGVLFFYVTRSLLPG